MLKFLKVTQGDIFTTMKNECKLPADNQHLVSLFLSAKAIQNFIKATLGSITMAVMSKNSENKMLSALEEDQVYTHLIEDFLNLSFAKRNEQHTSVILLMALPAFLHGTFIKPNAQQKVLEKVLKCLELVEPSPEHAYVTSILEGHLNKIVAQKDGVPQKAAKKANKKSNQLDEVKGQMARKRIHEQDDDSDSDEEQQEEESLPQIPQGRK